MSKHPLLGRILYALAFCVLIPALLVNGACVWEPFMKLTPICSPVWGGLIAVAGMTLMLGSMLALKRKGGGLPMNAYPPPKFVSTGFYGLLPHPIYWGFCLCCAGASVICGSAAGLYVMTPLAALGCAAIVYGYEKRDLERRFGQSSPPTLLGLAPDNEEKTYPGKRLSGCCLILAFWAVAYYGGSWTEVIAGAPTCRVFGESGMFFGDAAIWVYQSIYLIVPLVLLLGSGTNRRLRYLSVMSYGCFGLGLFLFLMAPFSCPLTEFRAETFIQRALLLDIQSLPAWPVAFPSFHALWAFIMAGFLWKFFKRGMGAAGWLWALLLCVSCVATGMHGWLDIIGARGVYLIVAQAKTLARLALKGSERLANSWACVMIGPWRVINHALYVFISAAGGFILIVSLAGADYLWPLVIVSICSLVGGGVWAQLVEGSSRLLRPFGYYGAIIGGIVGVGLAGYVYPLITGADLSGWGLFAAVATASPWIQAIGRLRCLVQGCCHGHPIGEAHAHWGTAHHNPASRVCRLTEWSGIPLHATPLYSIGFNLIAGWILLRLWCAGMPAGLQVGLYFMLAGLTRFVEESYRGEPQTHRPGGLSVYQWLAIAFIGVAFIFWNIPAAMVAVPALSWSWHVLIPATLIGAIYAFCMSTDFPASNKRFARLTS